jgi:hypothetical protein
MFSSRRQNGQRSSNGRKPIEGPWRLARARPIHLGPLRDKSPHDAEQRADAHRSSKRRKPGGSLFELVQLDAELVARRIHAGRGGSRFRGPGFGRAGSRPRRSHHPRRPSRSRPAGKRDGRDAASPPQPARCRKPPRRK